MSSTPTFHQPVPSSFAKGVVNLTRAIILTIRGQVRMIYARPIETVLAAVVAAVLGGIFVYIFNDFITNSLDFHRSPPNGPTNVSTNVHLAARKLITLPIGLLTSLRVADTLVRETKDPRSMFAALRFFGTPTWITLSYLAIWCTVLAALYVLASSAIVAVIGNLPLLALCLGIGIPVIITARLARLSRPFIPARRSPARRSPFPPSPGHHSGGGAWQPRYEGAKTVVGRMALWRLRQMQRNPSSLTAILIGLVFLTGAAILASHGELPGALLAGYLFGLFAAAPLLIQVADDINGEWMEQNAGMTRLDTARSYIILSLCIAIICGLVVGGTSMLAAMASGSGGGGGGGKLGALAYSKIATAAMLPTLAVPALCYQIEPKRWMLNMLAVFLLSFFLASGILASLWTIALVPVVLLYAWNYQVKSLGGAKS